MFLGFCVALVQVLVAESISLIPDSDGTRKTLIEGYRRLYQWDSYWYGHLSEHGYPNYVPTHWGDMCYVGFFPGYSLAGWLVRSLTRLPTPDAMLLTAQLAAGAFWGYLFAFLRRWRVHAKLSWVVISCIALHPAAFFLVAAYSESLFLVGVLGFLYWLEESGPMARTMMLFHAAIMTTTRIVGLPLAAVPFLAAMAGHDRWFDQPIRFLFRNATWSALAGIGGLAYFGYCEFFVGRWDLYMYAQSTGWGVRPDYLAIFRLSSYSLPSPRMLDHGFIDPNFISAFSAPLTLMLGAAMVMAERRVGGWRSRLGFYVCAGLMFYVAFAGLAGVGMKSMIRYSFCSHVLIALAAVHLAMSCREQVVSRRTWAAIVVGVMLLASAVIQIGFIRLFSQGLWVA